MYSFCRTCWTHCYGVVVARKHVAHDLRTGSGWSAQPMTAERIDAIDAATFLTAINIAINAEVDCDDIDVTDYDPESWVNEFVF